MGNLFKFKSRLGLANHGSLLRNIHFVWRETSATQANDLLKLNNELKASLINVNIICIIILY